MYRQITSILLFSAFAKATVPLYGQCGGSGYTGDTTCASPYTCQYQNTYYSQCLPKATTTTTTTTLSTSTTTASGSGSTAPAAYDQCGGQGWTGGTTCPSGYTCQVQNQYYSQCLPGSTTTTTTTTTTTPPSAGSSPTYKASITWYGSGDERNSGTCLRNTTACFFYARPGYTAAISQNFYGVGPGQGQGPACGTCWRVTGQTDSSGNALSNAGTSIVVKIDDLCPADSNVLCSQNGQSGTNQYGANVNFDLCSDSGAKDAFFANDGVGLAIGTATQVDCSQWSGTIQTS